MDAKRSNNSENINKVTDIGANTNTSTQLAIPKSLIIANSTSNKNDLIEKFGNYISKYK